MKSSDIITKLSDFADKIVIERDYAFPHIDGESADRGYFAMTRLHDELVKLIEELN